MLAEKCIQFSDFYAAKSRNVTNVSNFCLIENSFFSEFPAYLSSFIHQNVLRCWKLHLHEYENIAGWPTSSQQSAIQIMDSFCIATVNYQLLKQLNDRVIHVM